jgi:hypothetical protein
VSPGVIDRPWWYRLLAATKGYAVSTGCVCDARRSVDDLAEITMAIAFLIQNAFITGTGLDCDGGLRLMAGARLEKAVNS